MKEVIPEETMNVVSTVGAGLVNASTEAALSVDLLADGIQKEATAGTGMPDSSVQKRGVWKKAAAIFTALSSLSVGVASSNVAEAGVSGSDGYPLRPGSIATFTIDTGKVAVVNLAATETSGPGFFQYITDGTYPGKTANLNADHAGQTVSNLGLVEANPDGTVGVYTQSGGHVVADLQGYMVNSSFEKVTDERILDTRTGGAAVLPRGTFTRVLGRPNSTGVVSLTATEVSVPGYVQAMPCNDISRKGETSNLNTDRPGQTVNGLTFIKFDDNGCALLYNQGSTHLVADLQGYMAKGAFDDIADARLVDTRTNGQARPAAGTRIPLRGNKNSTAVINLAVTESQGPGYVQVVPVGGAVGGSSNLNVDGANRTVSGLAFVHFDENGEAEAYLMNGGHLVVDLLGYMGEGAFEDTADVRELDTRIPTVYAGGGGSGTGSENNPYVTLTSHNNGDYVLPKQIAFSCSADIYSNGPGQPESVMHTIRFKITGLVPDYIPGDTNYTGDGFNYVLTNTANGWTYMMGKNVSAYRDANGGGILDANTSQLVGSVSEAGTFSGILDITKITEQTRGLPDSRQGKAVYTITGLPCEENRN